MTVLLTGYEPFGDHEENPTAALARRLDGERVAGREVVGRVLPVEFGAAADRLAGLFDEHDPDCLLSTGLAAGRAGVSVERVGVNVNDAAGTPDNAEADPHNARIDPEGPDAYLSTLPVVRVVEALLDADIPAHVSNTAGTHLCNDALYSGRALVESRGSEAPVGFVHLPLTPAQAARKGREGNAARGGSVQPSMPLDLQERAVKLALETTLE